MSLEQHLFKPGARYRAKRTFVSVPDTFAEGEILTFERDGYSYYDNSFVYEFRSENGEVKSWWLHEDKPTSSWGEFFEPVDE